MWEKVFTARQLQTGAAFPLNYEFNQSILVIKASASNSRLTWHQAGFFYPTFLIPEIGEVQARAIQIKLGIQIVEIFNPLNYQFKAEFQTVDHLIDINLEFWVNLALPANDVTAQIANLTQLTIEGRENIALIQQQLDRIEQDINATTGQ